jgi:uncharacterized membrane protein
MSKIAPPRFLIFLVLLVVGIGLFVWLWHPLKGIMAGFDIAAAMFLLSSLPLVDDKAHQMRKRAKENDANKAALLAISVAVTTVILVAVGAVIAGARTLERVDVILIFGTLSLAWLFGNSIYAFHYAHMYYSRNKGERSDAGGIDFPGTKEPSYWDFFYFAFTLGMTFQTSDCAVASPAIRKVMIGHCLAAFVFNLGVLAFTINALGS